MNDPRILLLVVLIPLWAHPDAESLEFQEAFAWGDRTEALSMLVPGTEDFFYYTCLHHELEGEFEAFDREFARWKASNGDRWTSRMHELHRRRSLSAFEREPERTWEFLRTQAGHRFNHRPRHQQQDKAAPSVVRPEQVSLQAFLRQARGRNRMREFTDRGLELALEQSLNEQELREALGRLRRPDLPGLVPMILKDLQAKDSRGFGQHPIHRLLTRPQLMALGEQMPSLLDHDLYVTERLNRIPRPEADLATDHAAAIGYYREIWSFVSTLGPVHNSLKASTLYRLLDHQRHTGVYDEELFRTYLALPRPVRYLPDLVRTRLQRRQVEWVNFAYQPQGAVLLPPIGNEEPLVRDFLLRLLREDPSAEAYRGFFEEQWLGGIFAESKLLAGEGDPSDWARFLSPAEYRRILERVEVNLALDNPTRHQVGTPVSLAVELKNVERLLIKVYELHPFNYYLMHRAPVDQAVDLDGLVPTHEEELTFSAPPSQRLRHEVDLPHITERGVYVVELIGNGVSSRAVLQLGHLEAITQPTEHGLVMMVLDESGETVRDARVWMEGQEFEANKEGLVLIPFSENPGTRFVILQDGDFASPDQIEHPGEVYTFDAGIHVDSQSLVRRTAGTLLLRPDLRLQDVPVPLSRLQDVRVTLTTVDAQGTPSETVFQAEFKPDAEWLQTFYVQEGLREVRVSVSASLTRTRDGETVELTDQATLRVNQGRAGDALRQVFLTPTAEGWMLEVRGLNGEPISGEPLDLDLVHPAFTDALDLDVSTDRHGRVMLGELAGLSRIRVQGRELMLDADLTEGQVMLPNRLHARAGMPMSLPYPRELTSGLRDVSLFKVDGEVILEDVHDRLRIADGELQVAGLPEGSYRLQLHALGQVIRVEVVEGENRSGFYLGAVKRLQATDLTLPSLASVDSGRKGIELQLRNITPSTRVAVRAARYAENDLSFPVGGGFTSPSYREVIPPSARYISGRQLGDEIRYVLERPYQEIFAGTLLERPGLILNPWELRETTADREELRADEAYRRNRGALNRAAGRERRDWDDSSIRPQTAPVRSMPSGDIGVDFLPQGSRWWVNLRPDAQGRLALPPLDLEEQTQLEIVVIDRMGTSVTRHTLPARDFDPREVRLVSGLDPEQAFSRQKSITTLNAGETVEFGDLATTRYTPVQTLEDLYGILRTLSDDDQAERFAFLTTWPELDEEQKLARYHEFASHELHLFLYQQDSDFFQTVVRPYLVNKVNPTFVDRWLLEDLTPADLRLDRLQHRNALELALLARRSPVKDAALAALREAVDLIPPDPEGFGNRVNVALQAGKLDADLAEVRMEREEIARQASSSLREMAEPLGAAGSVAEADSFSADLAMPAAPEEKAAGRATLSLDESDQDVSVLGGEDPFGFEGEARRLYRALPKTKEWAEQNYFEVRMTADVPERVPASRFWLDVARGRELSSHVLEANRNLTEMVGALAFSALPFEAEPVQETLDAPRLELKVKARTLLVSEQILPAAESEDARPLLISQQIFRADDRYRFEGNERIEKFVSGEFIRRTVYGARVTLTNPTASTRRLNLLMQVPMGAIPVQNGSATLDREIELGSYTTQTVELFFTFPASGTFLQFPPQVAESEMIVGRTDPRTFTVVDAPTEVDTSSWAWISQHADPREVLTYLNSHNLRRLDLNEIAWRLKDDSFFRQVVELLQSRAHFHSNTFSYGILHRDPDSARIWLANSQLARQVGPAFRSPLLTVDPVVEKSFEHLEYAPLVNPRVHEVGDARRILNRAQRDQYRSLLRHQMFLPEVSPGTRLMVIYHLQLQDRLAEAAEQLGMLPEEAGHDLQVAYLQAWMAMRELRIEEARAWAEPYSDVPVLRWRKRFRDLLAQLDGEGGMEGPDPDRRHDLGQGADAQPSLELEEVSGGLVMTATHIPDVTLSVYPMELELLFSRTPFLAEGGDGFAVVRPALQKTVLVSADGEPQAVTLPEEFQKQNVMVEISGRGQRDSLAVLSNDLRVRKMEAFGQLEVRHAGSNEPVPKTYVKVFARDVLGNVSFWKDGYTDLRGRFDYLSLNDRQPEEAAELSILVLHPEHGAEILQAEPPVR